MKNFNFLENTTAIIVLYGENEKILGRNLDNLKNIKKIIIDNGGDKQLKKKIISRYNVEKYILNERNIGYSAACNQGLRLSDSKFSLIMNPDCIITEKNLKILCEKIDKYKDALIVFFYISRTTIYAEESLVLKNLLYKFMIRVAYMSTE